MISLLLTSIVAFAAPNLNAHVHGHAKLSIAFDKKNGKIELEIPGDSLFGFEREAKTKNEKAIKDKALKTLEDNISQMVVFESGLSCEIKKEVFEVNQNAGHTEINASFNVFCQKPVEVSIIAFNFQKFFPSLKKLQVEFLSDGVQKSQTIQKDGENLVIK